MKIISRILSSLKTWLTSPAVVYEVKSIAQTFIAAVAMFLVANWASVTHTSFTTDALVGLLSALARTGIKAVWVLVEPQLLSLLQKLSKKP